MKIVKVNIPKSDDGLENIKMERLGQIVILAGKNGSGKSRILTKIQDTLQKKMKKKDFDTLEKETNQFKQDLERHRQSLLKSEAENPSENLIKGLSAFSPQSLNYLTLEIKKLEDKIKANEDKLSWNLVETSEMADVYPCFPFVPKTTDLVDSSSMNQHQMENASKSIDSVGTNNFREGTLSKIQIIQNHWFEATHPESKSSEEDKNNAINEYKNLKQIIKDVLNENIERNRQGIATLFGDPISKAKLSEGQKILLQFCVAIHSQGEKLKDLILILDEPENHLHPSAVIEILDRIRKCVTNGQIWIATHSIPLLAHFDPSEIWYVKEGNVKHAGRIPEEVLGSLLGDKDKVEKLQDFISLPAQFATARYAFECLIPPSVIHPSSQDPQLQQIRDKLKPLTSGNKKLRILDYGAGKGRLISNMSDLSYGAERCLINKIDYVAYNKPSENLKCEGQELKDEEYCKLAITKAYGSCENRYLDDLKPLPDKSFDVVVMCNTLHEIPPTDWEGLFSENGEISRLLSDDGLLLLVEDHQIPTGEKAYENGFLVLDTPQLKILFNISDQDTVFECAEAKEDKFKGRLKAHIISKECLTSIDKSSLLAALESMKDYSLKKVKEIREQEANYKNGKLHGFWSQQFVNAELNIINFNPS